MQISLSDSGKRFNREWIFRNLNHQFISGKSYAITGPNGSGKSTLLQVIAGAIAASEGKISYQLDGKTLEPETVFRYISIAAPYEEVVEEMTLTEFLEFHRKFKPFLGGLHVADIVANVGLSGAASKQIRYFSSGMKQRVKLAQAFFSDTACLLLDEPCTNLDVEGIAMYQRLINDFAANRLVIVSSNDPQEYGFCEEQLSIMDFKK
jgi:ABC-type multidrug transport system ATPase subunit